MNEPISLSDAEWQVMKALWDAGVLTTANELAERLSATGWHLKTVRTMLTRLEKKGALRKKTKDGVYHYFTKVSQEDCCGNAAESFIDRVFDGALTPMVVHFSKRRTLSADDRKALEELLKAYDEGEE